MFQIVKDFFTSMAELLTNRYCRCCGAYNKDHWVCNGESVYGGYCEECKKCWYCCDRNKVCKRSKKLL